LTQATQEHVSRRLFIGIALSRHATNLDRRVNFAGDGMDLAHLV